MRRDDAAAPLVFALAPCRRLVASIRGVQRGRVSIGRFPNGELHAHIDGPVADRACLVVGSISPPDTHLVELTLLAHSLRRAGAGSITAVLPYLAYARQDRADVGEGLGLAWAGDLLRASGVDRVVSIDVHSEGATEILGLPLASLSPARAFAAALPPGWTAEDVTFIAPDEGAIGRCRALAGAVSSGRPIAVLSKRRSGAGVVHTELHGEVTRRGVIVDDILDTGATLLSCCRLLAAHGALELGVAVTHAVLTGTEWRGLWSSGVTRLWVTDTLPPSRARAAGAEIVPVAPLLAPLLLGRSTESPGGQLRMRAAAGGT